MLLPSANPFKCHEEVLYLQPMIPPKRFDIFPPLTERCYEGLDAFRFLFKQCGFVSLILDRMTPFILGTTESSTRTSKSATFSSRETNRRREPGRDEKISFVPTRRITTLHSMYDHRVQQSLDEPI